MRIKRPVHVEAARVRRTYYFITLVLVAGFSSAFIVSHYSILKKQNDDAIARLEDAILKSTKEYLKDAIDRTMADIDLERRLVREELGVKPGDPEAEREADAIARKRMTVRIREARLKNDGYIWINEVLDFKGGPGYAKRLVHRFLIDTEGMLLSTETRDAAGTSSYRVELDGILADGEIYHTYYFAKPGEQLPSLKLSYAKLYPDFSWIVATGVYLDDLERIVEYEKSVAKANIRDQAASSIAGYMLALLNVVILILLVDKLTSRTINSSYERIMTTENALREEKRKVEEAYALMKDLAERDELTGLRNRRSAIGRLTIEEARAKRTGLPFCLAIGDIDHFKAFNDRYGHNTGDAVLQAASSAIEKSVRLEDVAARWGGEEFLVLLSGDRLREAMEAADRIRMAVGAEAVVANGETLRVTITFGVAEYAPDGTIEELIARADAAMYQGKKAGRDTVVAAPPRIPS